MSSHPFKGLKFAILCALASLIFMVKSIEAAEKPHEHGVGHITIAIERSDVEVELTLPGADVVGFEHAPSSRNEKKAINMAVKALRNAKRIINFPAPAKCSLEDVQIRSGLIEHQKQHTGHRPRHKDKHKEHAHHESGHKHNTKSTKDNGNAQVHSEFIAHYHFHCKNTEKITSANIELFKLFPSAQELEAKWVTPLGQGAAELTKKNPNLRFR